MSEFSYAVQFTVDEVFARPYHTIMVGGRDDRQLPLRIGGMLMWGGLKVANFGRGLLLHKDPAA